MASLLIDDATAEALLAASGAARDPRDDRFDELAALLDAIRQRGDAPTPEPTGELAALFASPTVPACDAPVAAGGRRLHAVPATAKRVLRVAGGLGIAAKVALAAGAAAAAVGGASVAGVLPPAVQEIIGDVTPQGGTPSAPPTEPASGERGRPWIAVDLDGVTEPGHGASVAVDPSLPSQANGDDPPVGPGENRSGQNRNDNGNSGLERDASSDPALGTGSGGTGAPGGDRPENAGRPGATASSDRSDAANATGTTGTGAANETSTSSRGRSVPNEDLTIESGSR